MKLSLRPFIFSMRPWFGFCLLLALFSTLQHGWAACPTITPSEDWKSDVTFPYDPFAAYTSNAEPNWIKFSIFTACPDRVFFQDSREYKFHYNFARERLDPYLGISHQDFDAMTLHDEGQELVLGALLMPQQFGVSVPEIGIQLVGLDPYDPSDVVTYFNLVKNHVDMPGHVTAFYVPTLEQQPSALLHRSWFEVQGIPVSTAGRWASGNRVYSEGWALGRLKFFRASEVKSAFLSGHLETGDILMTDGIVADTPLVAGVISLSPATPNSHPVILAKTFQIPFLFLNEQADIERAHELLGRNVVVRAYENLWDPLNENIKFIDVEEELTAGQVNEILALKAPPALDIQPVAPLGALSAPTDGMTRADVAHFGGKAANFGYLRRAIPSNSPVSLALSFDLWSAFMEQEIDGGITLGDHIDGVLSSHAYPPDSMQQLSNDLATIRGFITNETMTLFTAGQKDAVMGILQDPQYGFDGHRKIRFRSSTNVEDVARFTGAGLYDSRSGCLADELDADETGPSLCDATKENERGVFRAIRRVYASFYNEGAVLERLRHGIDEHDVGMGVLVHHSFPDEIELANGVATLFRRSTETTIEMVTQKGAVSVANPEEGVVPEETEARIRTSSRFMFLKKQSNLVLRGATVMDWEKDYWALVDLLLAVSRRYHTETEKTTYVLDFEFKKTAPDGKLVVKQVREIPQPDTTPSVPTFLVNEPVTDHTFQGEASEFMAIHRLKSRFRFETRNTWLTPENLKESLYTDVSFEYTDGCSIRTYDGSMGDLPQAGFSIEGDTVTDTWHFPHLSNQRRYALSMNIKQKVAPSQCPILTQSDFGSKSLDVAYAEPVMTWGFQCPPCDGWGWFPVEGEYVPLSPRPQVLAGDLLQTRMFEERGGASVVTTFYWPPHPTGPVAGYTAPLSRWVETVITGLTSEPIVLTDWFSQTYRPEHHNFSEHFAFVPRLEPGIPRAILDELESKDIYMIYMLVGDTVQDSITLFSEADMTLSCECSTPLFIRGDANADTTLDLSDVILILMYLFDTGVEPVVLDACDANSDTNIDLADAIYLLTYLFGDGPPPAHPFPEPGCVE